MSLAQDSPRLSLRAKETLKGVHPLFSLILAKLSNSFSPDGNIDGIVNLGVAENSLMHEWLSKYFNDNFELHYDDFTYGTTMNGSVKLFKGLSNLFQDHFHPVIPVKPEHMMAGVGASAILDQLIAFFCDPGEEVLIATPYYNGFDNDIRVRSHANPCPVQIPGTVDPGSPETIQYFEQRMNDKNRPAVRAVILTNPHNPLGFCYKRETIIAYMKFSEKWDLHLIVDEIYALSLFEPSPSLGCTPQPFVSCLSIDPRKEAGCDPARVHMVYGMSKDFCANGLRIGILVSQHNPRLIQAFDAVIILMKISSASDMLWSRLLEDTSSLNYFLSENKRRLGLAYDHVVQYLNARNIPYRPSYAGHFIWIDLSAYLPTHDSSGNELTKGSDRESALFMRLLEEANIYIAPGMSYHATESGYFRLTFAMRQDYLSVGLERLSRLLVNMKGGHKPKDDIKDAVEQLKL